MLHSAPIKPHISVPTPPCLTLLQPAPVVVLLCPNVITFLLIAQAGYLGAILYHTLAPTSHAGPMSQQILPILHCSYLLGHLSFRIQFRQIKLKSYVVAKVTFLAGEELYFWIPFSGRWRPGGKPEKGNSSPPTQVAAREEIISYTNTSVLWCQNFSLCFCCFVLF